MLGFLTRREERDRYADHERIATLERVLDEIEMELLAEKTGFQKRYESAAITAAFAQQYYEDEVNDARSSAKVDDLTRSLKAFSERIAALDSQIGLVTGLRGAVRSFAVEHDID